MLAFYCDGEDIKKIMGSVFSGNNFDALQLRTGEITTRCTFTIDGRLNREFDGIEGERAYCLWSEVKHNAYDLIKGKKLPKRIKLVFALDDKVLGKLHPNAKAAFLNMSYEDGRVNFTTGTAQREFSMDKGLDLAWEDAVKRLFKKLSVTVNSLQ